MIQKIHPVVESIYFTNHFLSVTVAALSHRTTDDSNWTKTRLLFLIRGFLVQHFKLVDTANLQQQAPKWRNWRVDVIVFWWISRESPELGGFLRSSVFAAMPSRRPHHTAAMTLMKTSLAFGNLGFFMYWCVCNVKWDFNWTVVSFKLLLSYSQLGDWMYCPFVPFSPTKSVVPNLHHRPYCGNEL